MYVAAVGNAIAILIIMSNVTVNKHAVSAKCEVYIIIFDTYLYNQDMSLFKAFFSQK